MRPMRVGELARRTGLTVRTLHHYDSIGLLTPARRSPAGYRLYGAPEVARLAQIVLLRKLGLSLEEVGRALARPETTLRRTLELHLDRLREQIESERRLLHRLETMVESLATSREASIEELTILLEKLTMFEKHFTTEQIETLERRRTELGAERLAAAESEWKELIAAVRQEMERGTDPGSPEVRPLAKRWMELVEEFTGGDAALGHSVRRMYGSEPSVRERTGLDPEIFTYVSKAVEAAKADG